MSKIAVGKPVPDFTLPATGGKALGPASFRGKSVVLYFYPKDDTPGCTLEGQDFNANLSKFARKGAMVLGVSRDSLKSHDKFCGKFGFRFDLLADEDEKVCALFGVVKEKNMYGKKVWGIERSTFLIDPKGVLVREWRKVKVQGHAVEVLEAVGGSAAPAAKKAPKKRPTKKPPAKRTKKTTRGKRK